MDPYKADSVLAEGLIFLSIVLSVCFAFSWDPSLSFVFFDAALLLMSFVLLVKSHYRVLPSLLIFSSIIVSGLTHLTKQPGLIGYIVDCLISWLFSMFDQRLSPTGSAVLGVITYCLIWGWGEPQKMNLPRSDKQPSSSKIKPSSHCFSSEGGSRLSTSIKSS